MKFSVKKFAAGVAAVMLCAASALAAKPLEGQKLKMAVSPTFPPFEFERLDEQGNARIVGYDIDMVDRIAAELGFTYELVHTNFKGLMGELASHRVDFVVSGMSPTEERRKTVDFSVPYYYCQTSIIQHKGANIKTVADLKGKRIAASFGTQYADFAEAAGAVVAAMDSSTYSMQELLAGRADGVVQDAASASIRVKQHPGLEYFVLPQDELDKVQGGNVSDCFAAVFPKGSKLEPLFTGQIEKMQADGTMKAIYEKWIGPWPYGDAAAKPLQGEHYKLAINATFAPFEFAQVNDTGESVITGFDIDVLDAIAAALGFTYEIKDMNFSGLIGELHSGRADFVISGLSDTEERRKSVDFSVPYYFCKTAIVSPAAAPLKNMAEMKGKKIATVFGTEYAKVVEASGSIPTLLDNSTMVTQELLNGRVDGAVMDASQAKTKCEQNGGYVYHVIPNEDLESAHYVSGAYSIAFRKGSGLIPLFNEQIGKMFASGRMNELIVKWMGEEFVK